MFELDFEKIPAKYFVIFPCDKVFIDIILI